MAVMIYAGCALTSLLCAFLLMRAYWRSRLGVLWWSGLCFAGLTVANLVLVLDKLVLRQIDLTAWRLAVTLFAMLLLIYGLLREERP